MRNCLTFERFLVAYEFGSLTGQKKITLQHLKSKGSRLELPISLVKEHLKVSQEKRISLMDAVLAKRISYPVYKLSLKEFPQNQTSNSNCSQAKNHDMLINKVKLMDIKKMRCRDVNCHLLPNGSVMLINLDNLDEKCVSVKTAEQGFSDFLCGASDYRENNVIGIFMRYY